MSDQQYDRYPPRQRFFAGAVAVAAAALGLLGLECAAVMFDHVTPRFQNGVSIGLICSFVLCWLAVRALRARLSDKRPAFIGVVAVVVALLDVLPWAWTFFWGAIGEGIGMPH